MKHTFTMAAWILATAFAGQAQNIAGDWQGTLRAGGAELRLVVHIVKNDDGSFKGTMDSIDQGANGIPLSSIALKDSKLTFTALNGAYEGMVNPEGTAIQGTWSQGQPLPLDLQRGTPVPVKAAPKPAAPSDIDGTWLGTLDAGGLKLRLAFHITNTADGLTATWDSLDQNVKGLPVTSVTREGASLRMEMKASGATFAGKINKDLNVIDGTFTQAGTPLPLVLKRVKDEAELRAPAPQPKRPQNPVKPYPYREEELTYENGQAGIKLAATLTIPQGKGPFPAVVLITGSGPQDRDETVMGHKPFLVLADYLTRKGIAVLRADDRGIAKSGGNFATATAADFATDTEAGIAFLKTRSEVNPLKIGLIGHSEGGIIAPMVAARNHDVAFVVMMAGSGVRGDQILVAQVAAGNEAVGMSHAAAEKAGAAEREILTVLESEKDPAKLRPALARWIPPDQLDGQIAKLNSPWFRYFLEYDPAPALRKVTCPVLAINGEKDTQVPPKQNLPAIRKALEEGGNRHFEVTELPGLNHLFQTAKTGAVLEYQQIEETVSPAVLEKIANWILN